MAESAAQQAMGLPKDYDEAVRHRDAWYDTAAMFHRNELYYCSLLDRIGVLFGEAAETARDGSKPGGILRAKVPELVAELKHRVDGLDK